MWLAELPQSLLDERGIGQDPAVQGGVVHLQAALQEQFLDVTIAERVAQVPGDGLDDQHRLEMPALEIGLGALFELRGDGRQDHEGPPKTEAPCGPHGQRGVNTARLRQGR